MRFPIYEYLYQLNRNLQETVEILEHIRKSPGINKKQLHAYRVEIEHLRAEASQDVAESMNQIEIKESFQLWKQKRAYEKSLGDPDDVYFAVRDREEERRKQGLPSLIGVLRGHVREPEARKIKKSRSNAMTDKNAILGTTTLEWHSAEDIPAMHVEEYAGESWMQSEPLLLADAAGTMAVGYCQQPFDGRPEFDTVCTQRIGEIRSWALLGKPPVPKEPR